MRSFLKENSPGAARRLVPFLSSPKGKGAPVNRVLADVSLRFSTSQAAAELARVKRRSEARAANSPRRVPLTCLRYSAVHRGRERYTGA